jgi:hypothetical protein
LLNAKDLKSSYLKEYLFALALISWIEGIQPYREKLRENQSMTDTEHRMPIETF